MSFDAEDDRQGEAQSLVGDELRRWRNRVGALHHGARCFVEGRIAGAFDDIGRDDMAETVERELQHDLHAAALIAGWIAFKMIEMGDQLLLPGRAHALRGIADPCAGAVDFGASFAVSEVGGAVASLAVDSVEGWASISTIFGSSSFGFFDASGATTRSGSSVLVGVSFGRSVSSTFCFCSTTAGEAVDSSASGPGGRSVGSRRGAARS